MERIKLRPSAAARWLACPASVRLCEGIPDSPSGEAAQIGTAIHALAEICWLSGDVPANHVGTVVEGITITQENAEFAQLHLTTIKELELTYGNVTVEEHLSILDTKKANCQGTADVVAWDSDGDCLEIADLKTGRNYVDADSSQMKLYALGAIKQMGDFQRVKLTIVQPQTGANRTHEMLLADLLAWEMDVVMPAIEKAFNPDTYPTPSKDACKYCPAKLHCPALKEKAAAVPVKVTKELAEDEIAYWLNQADLVEGFYEELRKHATLRLAGGTTVPGWHLVPKRAIRKWKADIDIRDLPIETAKLYNTEPITPAQAEKLLSKDDRHLLDDLTEKVSSGLTRAKTVESATV
jgi:hypothetical protein